MSENPEEFPRKKQRKFSTKVNPIALQKAKISKSRSEKRNLAPRSASDEKCLEISSRKAFKKIAKNIPERKKLPKNIFPEKKKIAKINARQTI